MDLLQAQRGGQGPVKMFEPENIHKCQILFLGHLEHFGARYLKKRNSSVISGLGWNHMKMAFLQIAKQRQFREKYKIVISNPWGFQIFSKIPVCLSTGIVHV